MLGCASVMSLKERDTSVTAFPRSMTREGAPRYLGEEELSALLSGNGREAGEHVLSGTAGRWHDKCHLLPVGRDGSLAAKETRGNE